MIFAEWRILFSITETHLAAESIPEFYNSFVIKTKLKANKNIVFVHGFNGCPTKTWESYHDLLTGDSRTATANLYFYSYDSRHTSLDLAVQDLMNFLEQIEHKDSNASDLILIGHSLGGLMLRLALVDGWHKGSTWINKSKLILLAPAQAGARITQLVTSSFTSVTARFLLMMPRLKWVILDDLEPNSPRIVDLRDFLDKNHMIVDRRVIPVAIIVPRTDKVVFQRKLKGDPDFLNLGGYSHGGVSKAVSYKDSRYEAVISYI